LFGSQAAGQADASSDADFAVLVGGTVDPLLLWDLAGELADIVHLPVDLVDLRAASTGMQYQIITRGRLLWSDGAGAGVYEGFILNQKTEFDTARAGLLGDIYESGVVHGR
jgi:hypothetical protein